MPCITALQALGLILTPLLLILVERVLLLPLVYSRLWVDFYILYCKYQKKKKALKKFGVFRQIYLKSRATGVNYYIAVLGFGKHIIVIASMNYDSLTFR